MDNRYINYTYIYIFKQYDGWFFVVAFVPVASEENNFSECLGPNSFELVNLN